MADTGHIVYLTGSNAKMLSGEINTTLGGRYLVKEIYPYSFKEFLNAHHIPAGQMDIIGTEQRINLMRHYEEYIHDGGLPAAALLPVRTNYLNSVYQKIYLGDIIA